MRLFSAINPDPATADRLTSLQDTLRGTASRGNYSHPDNLHMTLVFLGEMPNTDVPAAMGAVIDLICKPFTMVVDHVGRDRRRGRELWWAGIIECRELLNLQRTLARRLDARGCQFDRRPFRPHITLAREVETVGLPWPIEPFSWPVTELHLMKSERINNQLVYSSLGTSRRG